MGRGRSRKVKAIAGADAERARASAWRGHGAREQVRAYGGPRFQLTQQVMNRFAERSRSPRWTWSARGGGSSGENGSHTTGNVMEALLTMLLSEKVAPT